MSIRVRYFASLKENLAKAEECVDATNISTVFDVWQKLNPDKSLPHNTLVALNMDYADLNAEVKDGDEVAFFPPVTGG